MGIIKRLLFGPSESFRTGLKDDQAAYRKGCELLGPGRLNSVSDRLDRVKAGNEWFARQAEAERQRTEPVYWNKVKMSYDADSGTYQTDNYIGIVGDTGQKSKAHVAVNADGEVVYVRDIGGEVLYDKKNGVGYLPGDLDWSK